MDDPRPRAEPCVCVCEARLALTIREELKAARVPAFRRGANNGASGAGGSF